MEQLTVFFTSNEGRTLCYAFIFVGITDFLIAQIALGSQLKKLERSTTPAKSQEELHKIEKQVNGFKKAMNLVRYCGMFFIAVAVFGLTR